MKGYSLFVTIFRYGLTSLYFIFWSIFSIAQTTLKLDRPTATYAVGETALFQFTSDLSGTAEYKFYREANGTVLSSGTLTISAGVTTDIPFTSNQTGTIFCEVNLNGVIPISAAIFSPFDLNPLEPEPNDFDAFWQAAKNELSGIPIDAQVTFERNNSYSTTYRVNLANIDNRRVYGYLTVPNGDGPFPAVIKFPAFGDSPNLAGIGEDVAERAGALYFSMNIHNVEPDQRDPNSYQPNSLDNPNDIFYKTVVTAGIRVIDYLHTRIDFDGQNVGLMGESQGGGITLMVAGTDDRVDAIISSNPTHCQNLGFKYGEPSGFGFFLDNSAPEQHQQSIKYYDNIYFARRFKGVSWMMISYEDDVCPAITTFAAFNQLAGPKILTHSIDLKHVHPGQFWNERFAFFRRYLPTAQPSNPNADNDISYLIKAGDAQNIPAGSQANLSATVINNTATNANLTLKWMKISGPGIVTFSNDKSYTTSAGFSEEGTYILRFMAEDTELINNNPPQYFTYMDDVRITVGNCTDNDGDGICADQDCDDNDGLLPAAAGTLCDDGNPNTENDMILADGCTCEGTPIAVCVDNDGDGVCAADDCDDTDNTLPASAGTLCDDGNPNTENDMIQDDGCTCLGTTDSDPTLCDAEILLGNGTITVSGMDEPNFRLQIFNQYWSETYYECFWNNCPINTTVSNLETGTYVVKVQSFTEAWSPVCDFVEYVAVVNSGGQCEDNGGDGVCAADDCDDADNTLPALAGTLCDDGDADTENDMILADGCTCEGTPIVVCIDNDGDGVCAADDCDDTDNTLPALAGTLCDDGNPDTENDMILADGCTCEGTPIAVCTDNDGDGVCAADDCDDADNTLPALAGTLCDDGDADTENDMILADGCTCEGTPIAACIDNDGDGVCAADDCDDTDDTLPALAGTLCDDGDADTENDMILADGCTCEGTPIITGEPSCDNVQFEGRNDQLIITGLTAPIEILRVRNSQWQEIYSCIADCDDVITISNLQPGLYRIQIQMYNENWGGICYKETETTLDATASNRNQIDASTPKVHLYPNPAEESVNIRMFDTSGGPMELNILNQLGKVILHKENIFEADDVASIDLNSFTNGLYFIQLSGKGNKTVTKKLLVSKLY